MPTLTEIKKQAVTDALCQTISTTLEEQDSIIQRLRRMDAYNKQREGVNLIKEFRAHQKHIEDAFSELFDPKPGEIPPK